MRIRDRLGITERRQRQITRAMEILLVGMFFVGLDRGASSVVVTAAIGLGVTFLPAMLERDLDIPMDPALVMWITGAVFLHTAGVVGIPGVTKAFYNSIPYYDHLTHALSSSVVAGTGYATVRAFDEHSSEVELPSRFIFVFIVLFVFAFGVFWELIEFGVDVVGTATGAGGAGFTQHGLSDTMLDLVFNTIGGIVVALWGTVYLTDVSGAIQERFERRSERAD